MGGARWMNGPLGGIYECTEGVKWVHSRGGVGGAVGGKRKCTEGVKWVHGRNGMGGAVGGNAIA
eukprot:850864-Pelagomonas_calceolata.AAC.4